jgi:16S rRNA (guanine(966)-N(2))-methyltransferase RsmD
MRIISGRLKGRRLRAPTWDGLRPTSDRLRETLFNVLAARVPGARVLDGFAGTGAVGIEALSRGAAHVTFVELDRRAAALVTDNAAACGLDERRDYTVERGAFVAVARRLGRGSFDLILLDPPYGATGLGETLEAARPLLSAGGVLVLERATRRPPDVPDGLSRVRDIRSGDSTLTMLATTAGTDAPPETP